MKTAFVLTAELATPLILSVETFLTLDSLLAGVIFESTGSIERALADIPLERTYTVWHGSAVFLESCAIRSMEPFKRGLGMRDIGNGALERLALRRIERGRRRGQLSTIDTVRGPHQTTLSSYLSYLTPRVYWFGCGDIDRVQDLVNGLPAIGKKRRQGYGQVAHIEIEPVETDSSLSMVTAGTRHAMRPLTLESWERLYREQPSAIGCTRPSLPYFTGEAHLCAIPPAREVFWRKFDKRFVL
ncbi:MAG: hypothetical protein ACP5P4_14845 [Steroidobacteraceae bacterium]